LARPAQRADRHGRAAADQPAFRPDRAVQPALARPGAGLLRPPGRHGGRACRVRRRAGRADRGCGARAVRHGGQRGDRNRADGDPSRRDVGAGARLTVPFSTQQWGERMIRRRTMLAGLASAAVAPAALAQSWKSDYPELVYAVVPAENASGVVNRYTPFAAYLSNALGTKVTLRVANDYAAVIEGQRAGNIHIGYYGPASFSRARMTGVQTEAFVIDVNSDGTKGYYSVFYVRADSPYHNIQDLKGKNLGLVDPNSTSGYNMPLYTLDKLGIEAADQYFSKVLVTGSHENAVI